MKEENTLPTRVDEYAELVGIMGISVSKHLFDEHFTLLWANDNYFNIIGYTKEEYETLFHNCADYYLADNKDIWDKIYNNIIEAINNSKKGCEVIIKMPGMDGIEATHWIREIIGPDIPIIILSAYDTEEYEEEAKEAKANGFISKPLYRSKLIQILRRFLVDVKQEDSSPGFSLSDADYSGKRLLLVEDNELNREIAVEIIGSTGITIDTAVNGLEAFEMVERAPIGYYQLILMDIQMPVMDGYEATRRIRTISRRDIPDLPIIAMTANAFSEDVTSALKAGMNFHLAKPIDIKALMNVLEKYL